jgi:hypothetical protein
MSQNVFTIDLIHAFETDFSLEELKTFCTNFSKSHGKDFDYEQLDGDTRAVKSRELVMCAERREKLGDLEEEFKRLRPNSLLNAPNNLKYHIAIIQEEHKFINEDFRKNKKKSLNRVTSEIGSLKLNDIFVFPDIKTKSSPDLVTLENILKNEGDYKKTIILGDELSGKTALLSFILLEICNRYQGDIIPIYMSLEEWDGRSDLLELIPSGFRNQRFVFLLDDYD